MRYQVLLPVVDGWDQPNYWVPELCVWQVFYSEPTGGPAAYLAHLKKLTWLFPGIPGEVLLWSVFEDLVT